MASDLTPEELTAFRILSRQGLVTMAGDTVGRLLDMAERCAKAEADAANLRERLEQAERERDHVMHKVLPAMREREERAMERLRLVVTQAQVAADCGCMCPSGEKALRAAIERVKETQE